MKTKLSELFVGVFLLAGVVSVAFLAMNVGNLDSESSGESYRVSASFDNIGGLNAKSPVTLAGVRIGRVTSIQVDRDRFNAVVNMSISSAYNNLPLDTSASILTSGLLGSQYIGLDPGGDIEVLQEGSVIDITQSAIVLENLISKFLFSQAEK